ncbi:hypothetical protein O3M35_006595 [Rhynocoris fuscipes]|uniref:NADH dehydrogenase [ubiquinone] 1 alpha subcomplex subunit 7 n=1 Tax=Rhynocoris fuscipes TaxID=488301 RepID=A0AAW1DGS7_9HEMI
MMSKKVEIRSVSNAIAALRNALLGREHTSHLRYKDLSAPRSYPSPDIPRGPAHKLSNNYYYDRDPRRQAATPQVIYSASSEQIQNSRGVQEQSPKLTATPGSIGFEDSILY